MVLHTTAGLNQIRSDPTQIELPSSKTHLDDGVVDGGQPADSVEDSQRSEVGVAALHQRVQVVLDVPIDTKKKLGKTR